MDSTQKECVSSRASSGMTIRDIFTRKFSMKSKSKSHKTFMSLFTDISKTQDISSCLSTSNKDPSDQAITRSKSDGGHKLGSRPASSVDSSAITKRRSEENISSGKSWIYSPRSPDEKSNPVKLGPKKFSTRGKRFSKTKTERDSNTTIEMTSQYNEWSEFLDCYAKGQYNISKPPPPPRGRPDFKYFLPPQPMNNEIRVKEVHKFTFELNDSTKRKLEWLLNYCIQSYGVKGCSISLINDKSQVVLVERGLSTTEIPLDKSLEGHTLLSTEPVAILDTASDWRVIKHPMVLTSPSVKFWASAPIISSSDEIIGAFSIFDPQPRQNFGLNDKKKLGKFACSAFKVLESQVDPSFLKNISQQTQSTQGNEGVVVNILARTEKKSSSGTTYAKTPAPVNSYLCLSSPKVESPTSAYKSASHDDKEEDLIIFTNSASTSPRSKKSHQVGLTGPQYSSLVVDASKLHSIPFSKRIPFSSHVSTMTVLDMFAKITAAYLKLDFVYFLEVGKWTESEEREAETDRLLYGDILGSPIPEEIDSADGRKIRMRVLAAYGLSPDELDFDAGVHFKALNTPYGLRYDEQESQGYEQDHGILVPIRRFILNDDSAGPNVVRILKERPTPIDAFTRNEATLMDVSDLEGYAPSGRNHSTTHSEPGLSLFDNDSLRSNLDNIRQTSSQIDAVAKTISKLESPTPNVAAPEYLNNSPEMPKNGTPGYFSIQSLYNPGSVTSSPGKGGSAGSGSTASTRNTATSSTVSSLSTSATTVDGGSAKVDSAEKKSDAVRSLYTSTLPVPKLHRTATGVITPEHSHTSVIPKESTDYHPVADYFTDSVTAVKASAPKRASGLRINTQLKSRYTEKPVLISESNEVVESEPVAPLKFDPTNNGIDFKRAILEAVAVGGNYKPETTADKLSRLFKCDGGIIMGVFSKHQIECSKDSMYFIDSLKSLLNDGIDWVY
ncbi:hypothetical protein V1511DRAFT_501404 [Dipodascopsis uninucleata]